MATVSPPRTPRPMTAADVMTPSPRTCSPFSSVLEAVLIFRDADCGAVPVVDAGQPVGILTDRDVALALADHPDLAALPVSEVMTQGTITVRPDATLHEVMEQLTAHAVRRVLVADDSGLLLGVIAWSDLAARITDCDVGAVVTDIVQQP